MSFILHLRKDDTFEWRPCVGIAVLCKGSAFLGNGITSFSTVIGLLCLQLESLGDLLAEKGVCNNMWRKEM
jgi:hypothetical protein